MSPLAYLKNQISTNFLYMLPVAAAQSFSDGNAVHLCTSGFVDDVITSCSHDRANGRESETTRIFRRVRQVAALGRSCRLRLHVVHRFIIYTKNHEC